MSFNSIRFGVVFFTFLCSFLQGEAYQAVPITKSIREGTTEFTLLGNYFDSSANYTNADTYSALPLNASLQVGSLDFEMRWVPKKRWGVFAGLEANYAMASGGGVNHSNSGLSSGMLGVDYLAYRGLFDMSHEAYVVGSFYNVDQNTTSSIFAEGANIAGYRLVIRKAHNRTMFYGFGGYEYRDGGRSSLAPYGLGFESRFSRWGLGGELSGFSTVDQDQYTSSSVRRTGALVNVNAGSYYFDSVNPSVLQGKAWGRFQFDEYLDIQIGAGQTITGTNYANGYNVFFGFNWHFDPSKKPAVENSPNAPAAGSVEAGVPMSQDRAIEKFEPKQSDELLEELFKLHPPPPDKVEKH